MQRVPIPKSVGWLEPFAFRLLYFAGVYGWVDSRSQCKLANNGVGVRNDMQRRSVSFIDEVTSSRVALILTSNTFAEEPLDLGISRQTHRDTGKVQRPAHRSLRKFQILRTSGRHDASEGYCTTRNKVAIHIDNDNC